MHTACRQDSRELPALKDPDRNCYICLVVHERTGKVRLAVSRDPGRRIRTLRVAGPVRLLAAVRFDSRERAGIAVRRTHRAWVRWRRAGGWYGPEAAVWFRRRYLPDPHHVAGAARA